MQRVIAFLLLKGAQGGGNAALVTAPARQEKRAGKAPGGASLRQTVDLRRQAERQRQRIYSRDRISPSCFSSAAAAARGNGALFS